MKTSQKPAAMGCRHKNGGYALKLITAIVVSAFGATAFGAAHAQATSSSIVGKAPTDSTITMLSYKPDTVDKDLGAAQNRLTGQFKDVYGSLIHDMVIPGSKEKQISAVATVPAAASLSVTENRGVVLVFVNQTVTIGKDTPISTASRVRVTLDKVGDRWLISQFDPI
jgi:Mce-associated membrane protein